MTINTQFFRPAVSDGVWFFDLVVHEKTETPQRHYPLDVPCKPYSSPPQEQWKAEAAHFAYAPYGNASGVVCEVRYGGAAAIITPNMEACRTHGMYKFAWIVEPLRKDDSVVLFVSESSDPRGPIYWAASWQFLESLSVATSTRPTALDEN